MGRGQGSKAAGRLAEDDVEVGRTAPAAVLLNIKGTAGETLYGIHAAFRQKRGGLNGQRAGACAGIPENSVGVETQERKGRRPHGRLCHQAVVGNKRGGVQSETRAPGNAFRQQEEGTGRAKTVAGGLGQRSLPEVFMRKAEILERMEAEMPNPAIQQRAGEDIGRRSGICQDAERTATQRRRQKGMEGVAPVQGHGGHVVPRQANAGARQLQAGRRGMDTHGAGTPAANEGRADTEEERIAIGQHNKAFLPQSRSVKKGERAFQRRGKRQETRLRKGGRKTVQ